MLRRAGARLARAAHLLGNRQIDADKPVACLGVAIAAADSCCGSGEKRLDLVHTGSPWRSNWRSLSFKSGAGPLAATCPSEPANREAGMSKRIDKSWLVLASLENCEHDRCVDLFRRPDGTFGFEEFRRDVEDAGAWTPVQFQAGRVFPTRDAALAA